MSSLSKRVVRDLLRRRISPSRPSSLPCVPSIANSLPMLRPSLMRRSLRYAES